MADALSTTFARFLPGPAAKVWMLTSLMVVMSAGLMLVAPTQSFTGWPLIALFAAAYFVSESFVFNLEIRKQAYTCSIREAILVIAVFTIDGVSMVAAAAIGAAVALRILRGLPPLKLAFNVAIFALEAAIVAAVVPAVTNVEQITLAGAAIVLFAVALADVAGATAVFGVIWIFEGRPRRRHAMDVYRAQMAVTLIGGSFGVLGAAAFVSGVWVAVFLLVVGAGMVAIFQQHARVTARYSGLQTLHDFSRTIANDVDVDRVLVTAMTDVVDVIAATSVSMVAVEDGSFGPAGIYRTENRELVWTPFADDAVARDWRSLMTEEATVRDVIDLPGTTAHSVQVNDGQIVSMTLGLRDDESVVFVATKSARAVGVFDQSSSDQVGALVRQLSATLRNGLFVQHLDEASRRDELTGLMNRRELIEQIDAAAGRPMLLTVIGLQAFDEVNETLGHATGDDMLRAMGDHLSTHLGDAALGIARVSGGTFAVLFPNWSSEKIIEIVTATMADIAASQPSGLRLDMRCRAGFATMGATDDFDGATLVQRGDLALNEAARSGLRIEEFRVEFDDTQRRRVMLVSELRAAIAAEQFELWFQPKLDLQAGRIIGAEALIRWKHDELGFVPPDEFISLAETAGLVNEITEQVLEMAAREARRWVERGTPLMIAVNLSAHDLVDPELPRRLANLLERHRITTDHLGIELTETAVVADGNQIIRVLEQLREDGFTLYVDDYGTGYSSLSYLRSLPIHSLKIDQAFVRHLAENEDDDVIVRSTIDMAHNLGLSVVAEGVENLEAYDRLRALGCETAQGYYMARPMPSEDFAAWVEDFPTLRAMLGYESEDAADEVDETAAAVHEEPAPRA